MKKKIFISYSREDIGTVKTVEKILEKYGYKPKVDYFLDEKAIEPGDEIVTSLREGINESAILLLLLSKNSLGSPWVIWELGVAMRDSSKKIVSLLLDNTIQVPEYISRYKYLNSIEEFEDYINSIQSKLSRTIDKDLDMRFTFAKERIYEAGSRVLGHLDNTIYETPVVDSNKKNFPTKADIEANKIIIDYIQKEQLTRPDGIISEEIENDPDRIASEIENHEFVWVVDPLDGTLNFYNAFPFYCTSIGLIRNREPVMGIIFNPGTQEIYYAIKGQNAFKQRIGGRPSSLVINSSINDLKDSIVLSHLSSSSKPRQITLEILDDICAECRSVRMLGSGQMAIMSLVENRFQIFFNYKTNLWDILPGYVILSEAGGYCTTCLSKDNSWSWQSQGIIAAVNNDLGTKFRNLVQSKISGNFPQLV